MARAEDWALEGKRMHMHKASIVGAVLGAVIVLGRVAAADTAGPPSDASQIAPDSFSWLEDVHGPRAMAWVKAHNERTLKRLDEDGRYSRYLATALLIEKDKSHVPTVMPGYHGGGGQFYAGWIYDVVKDDAHPNGVLRRSRYESFKVKNSSWRALLDLNSFSASEGHSWNLVLDQSRFLPPSGRRALLYFRDGNGGEQSIIREFDLDKASFVQGGFNLPVTAYPTMKWLDENTVLVSTDFGPTGLMSQSGLPLPLVIKQWKRGQPLASAKEIFRGEPDGQVVKFPVFYDQSGRVQLALVQYTGAADIDTFKVIRPDGSLMAATLPPWFAEIAVFRDQLVLRLERDWLVGGETWSAGSLVSVSISQLTEKSPAVRLLMKPAARQRVLAVRETRAGILMSGLENLRGRLWRFRFDGERWSQDEIRLPDNGTVDLNMSDRSSDHAFAIYQNFLQPTTLYDVDVRSGSAVPIKSLPAQFDASNCVTEQLEAISADGEHIPYFLVRPKALKYNGKAPTLMHDYGFLGGLNLPLYSGTLGRLWLEDGGVYVLSNVRGGSAFGPGWEVSGDRRMRTYEDFVAVANDLIRRGITSPAHLGIHGLSNGGILVGVALTQHPELFNAAVLQNPVVDLLRPDLTRDHRPLLMLYGTPEVQKGTSPFQHLSKRAQFPEPLLTSSTNDEIVQPGQPRRFAAKLESLQMPFFYYEAPDGGHGSGFTPEQRAEFDAIFYAYFAQHLM